MASRDLKVTLIGEDKLSGSFSTAQKGALAFGSAVGNLAANGITAGVTALKNFASGSVDAFASLEDAQGAAGVTFGKATSAIDGFATAAAKNYGISQRAATEAAITFGTLGKSAGMSGEDLAGFSTKFAGLAGDLASFRGTSPEQAIEAIGAALRGESEPIRAYGVLLDDASLRQEALSQGLIKTTKEALTPQQKVLATQALILKQTTDAQGDFQRTADSTANTQKTLTAEMENQQAVLGAKLAPAVTAMRQAMIDLIGALAGAGTAFAAVTGFIGDNSKAFVAAATVLGAVFGPALVAMGVSATINGAKVVAAWVAQQLAAMKSLAVQSLVVAGIVGGYVALGASAVASVAKQVAAWALLGVQSLLNAAKVAAAWIIAMGPIAIVAAAVIGLVVLIVKNWDTIKQKTAEAWAAFAGFVSGGVTKAVGFVKELPGKILSALGNIGDLLKGAGQALIQGLIDGITSKLGAIADVMGKVADKVKGFLPGSPVKEGPLTAWNNGAAGQRLMGMLADGIAAGRPAVAGAMNSSLSGLTPSGSATVGDLAAGPGSGMTDAVVERLDRLIGAYLRSEDRMLVLARTGAT